MESYYGVRTAGYERSAPSNALPAVSPREGRWEDIEELVGEMQELGIELDEVLFSS